MKNYYFKNSALLIFLFSTFKVHAAAESQYWTSIQASAPINSDFGFVAEYINRYSEDDKEWVVRSNRVGFSYKFLENWTYALQVENRDTNSNANNEIRYINQFSRSWKSEDFNFALRWRYEFREFNDSLALQNRLRLLGRVDAHKFKFAGITPITTFESFYILNETTNARPAGATETRAQIGGSFKVLDNDMELVYLARQQYRPQNTGLPSRTSDYNVVSLVYKISIK